VAAKFVVYKGTDGYFRWHLRAATGGIVASSGERYRTKGAAEKGIQSVKDDAPVADVVHQTVFRRSTAPINAQRQPRTAHQVAMDKQRWLKEFARQRRQPPLNPNRRL
jgi:hypothetical protein